MTFLRQKDNLIAQSLHTLISRYSLIHPEEESELTQKFVWRKHALIVRKQLGDVPNSVWADTLGVSFPALFNSLEEAELAEKRLLAMGLRLSLSLAQRQGRNRYCLSEDLSDFVHDGLITFFDAVESFDSSRGIRLSTYAYSQIRSRFTEFNRHHEKAFRASKLGTLMDFDCSPLDFEDKATNVHEALNELPERQRLILIKRFGIQCQIQSAQDIAKAFGVSCETIRKDQIAAMSALKKNRNLKDLAS